MTTSFEEALGVRTRPRVAFIGAPCNWKQDRCETHRTPKAVKMMQ